MLDNFVTKPFFKNHSNNILYIKMHCTFQDFILSDDASINMPTFLYFRELALTMGRGLRGDYQNGQNFSRTLRDPPSMIPSEGPAFFLPGNAIVLCDGPWIARKMQSPAASKWVQLGHSTILYGNVSYFFHHPQYDSIGK